MAELFAVAGDTLTPISWGVSVNGSQVITESMVSATATIDGVTFTLTVDNTLHRLTGTLPEALCEIPGVYTGYITLVTNNGTFRFPDGNLSLEVLEGQVVEVSDLLVQEDGSDLITEDGFFLELETV